MADHSIPPDKREFYCSHCNSKVIIPADLPPTTGPCPHCGQTITSPDFRHFQKPAPQAAQPAPEPSHEALRVDPPRKETPPQKSIAPLIVAAVLLLAIAAGALFAANWLLNQQKAAPLNTERKSGETPEMAENLYLSSGWVQDARRTLDDFIKAQTVEGKLPSIIGGESKAKELEDFYGGSEIIDFDTPASAFSEFDLSRADHEKGIFLLTYDQPAQLSMRDFFRPLAPLEVQYGVDAPDILLVTLAKVSNFTMEPMKVFAFFKRTKDGMKLDWDTFAQTKYHTMATFIDLPEPGQKSVFRVVIFEDVPPQNLSIPGYRTYRVADPAHTTASALVNVKVDSEIGRTLSTINWRNEGLEGRVPRRTATVELEWAGSHTAPELKLSRFICWEFLGLGGTADEKSN